MWLARKNQTVVFDCRCCARFEGGFFHPRTLRCRVDSGYRSHSLHRWICFYRYLRTTASCYFGRYLYETGHIDFPHFCRMTYSYHQIDHFCHPQLDFLPGNNDGVCSHLESHFCANGGDRLTEKIDDMISQVSGADFFYREIGGDQNLYSTVSGVVTCHENMSLKTVRLTCITID